MKKFILLPLLCISGLLFAQYSTPGNNHLLTLDDMVNQSAGAISFDGSDYHFNEEITISVSDTLLINQDGVLYIHEGLLWTIQGVLKCEIPNLFEIKKPLGESNFEGIRVEDSHETVLNKLAISGCGGIKLVESDVLIEDCAFSNFGQENSTAAVDIFQCNPIIKNSSFTNNAGPAIGSGANAASSPQIINNILTSNVSVNSNTPQINLGTSDGVNDIIIDSNQVFGMYEMAGGIAVSTLTGGSISALIRHNLVEGNRYGIAMIGSDISAEIIGNTITDNNIQNDPMLGGSGLNFYGGETNQCKVSDNKITGNLWGVTIQLSAQPNLGDGGLGNNGENQIYNNGNNGVEYALYNNTSGTIQAKGNYWGTETIEETEEVIFHQPDDSSLGEVFYDPIWVPVGIEEQALGVIELYPNPASDYINVISEFAGVLSVFNLSGQLILTEETDGKKILQIEQWESGIYFYQIVQNQRLIQGKFVKK